MSGRAIPGRRNPAGPMQVQIVYTVEAPDDYRRAINGYQGRPGLATRGEVRAWHVRYGTSLDSALMSLADSGHLR